MYLNTWPPVGGVVWGGSVLGFEHERPPQVYVFGHLVPSLGGVVVESMEVGLCWRKWVPGGQPGALLAGSCSPNVAVGCLELTPT